MQRWARFIALNTILALGLCVAAASAETVWPEATFPLQINLTADSAPGWDPSGNQIAEVRKTADAFFAAEDEGKSAEAYALLADQDRQYTPFSKFEDEVRTFNTKAGPLIDRRVTTVTWTKDPAQAPAPGIYAALDMTAHFANVDRFCGFLILYQPPAGGPFRIMREEKGFMDNTTAKKIEQTQSLTGVDRAWAAITANCPNYRPDPPPLPEAHSSVGYASVAEALEGLHKKPGVAFTTNASWTIADDSRTMSIWSFAPAEDPSYPSVVKRQIVQTGSGVEIKMSVLCESTKVACDALVRQFQELNAKMKASPVQR